MISILDLKNVHAGFPAVVLGGGLSLRSDLDQVPAGRIVIAANHHNPWPFRSDYLVFMDDPEKFPQLRRAIDETPAMLVSTRREWTDVDLGGAKWWNGRFTGHLAAWLGCWMGCDPVILCGFDCYQVRPPGATDSAYDMPLEKHLDEWRQAFTRCYNPERIRAVSGPLVEVFGKQGE